MCKGILFRIFLVLLFYLCKNVAGTPNMVSISVVGHTGPMVEGTWYELRCDVQKVAPDQLLTVRWYKGQTLLTDTSFNDSIKTPVDKSATYWIFANTTDDGAEYRCEAVLRQRQAGPQPPTTEMSEPLLVTVYCNCPVVLQPPAVVVEYGTSVSVNCSTSKPHFGMAWEVSQGAVDPQEGVQLITWNVPRLEEWDIKPLCYINIKNQTKPDKRHLPVIVYKTPDNVSISIVNHTGPVTEGTQYELQCDVQNVAPVHRLTVKWYKGQTLLTDTFFNDPTKTPVNRFATLQISPSRADDAADYWCEAELRLGPAAPQPPTMKSDPLHITVHYGPEISDCPEYVWLKEGENLEGYCSVTGNPLPEPRWLKAGKPIDPTSPLRRTENRHNYTMYINEDTRQHLMVFVMYGPEISCRKHITVLENEEVEPNCTAEGFPPPEVTWFKEEQRVYFPQRMQRADAGKYVLVAVNNSTSNHTLEIEVQYSPSDIMGLNDQSVTQGSKVDLNCTSSAWPRPDYEWIYHPEPNVRIVSEDGVSKLSIASASGNNTGTYTCIASNTLGKTNLTVRVDVQGAEALCPLIVNPSHVVLEYRGSVVVECNTSVSPSDLHWEFLNHRVNNGTLLVNSSQFKNWDETPRCTGKFIGLDTCTKHVDITLYKTPDNVSISIVNHTGPVIEGTQYELQCDVQNVAPVQLLTVKWYKGQTLLTDTFFNDSIKTPVNQSATLQISPSRADDAADYWCEAELRLGPAGPQPPPTMKSNPLNITVYYKPVINKGKLPATMPVFWGYPEVLVCEAEGHPSPVISWTSTRAEGGNLTITVATIENDGVYNCTATNSAGTDIVSVKVVMKVDSCPVMLTPPVVLLEYGASISVDCSTSIAHRGMGWEASQGQVDTGDDVQLITWSVPKLVEWDIKPVCYVIINKAGIRCQRSLTIN
uniref:Ig-like domain-containing protein n=1 Tax=Electrophorus electricus TaxID=8005 RepID=A0AAY5F6L0_ELEEL